MQRNWTGGQRKKNTVETVQEKQHAFFQKYLQEHPSPSIIPPARALQSMDYRLITQAGYCPAPVAPREVSPPKIQNQIFYIDEDQ